MDVVKAPDLDLSGPQYGTRFMSSRFFPALLQVLWEAWPLPEWLPAADEQPWLQTIQALTQLWREAGHLGVVISGPIPWLPEWEWKRSSSWTEWQVDSDPFQVNPQGLKLQRWLFTSDLSPDSTATPDQTVIPVLPRDPMLQEQFLLLITPIFNVIAAHGFHPRTGQQGVMISFDPEVIHRAWTHLEARVQLSRYDVWPAWMEILKQLPLQIPHFRVLSRYSSLVLMASNPTSDSATIAQLPASTPCSEPASAPRPDTAIPVQLPSESIDPQPLRPDHSASEPDLEDDLSEDQDTVSETLLLRALFHEVKTPLTTIRTLVQLVLRQPDLPAKARKHLEKIDQECTEQINRFNLFFQATEPDPQFLQLEPTGLVGLIEQNLPNWQRQVQRYGSNLTMEIPDDLPDVVSDPNTLSAVLSGMVDRIARISPPGSQIKAHLVSAGEQVKLQFQVNTEGSLIPNSPGLMPLQAIGQLLVLQPDTGAISLSIPVTQTLFRALGGYLTVRQKAQKGEIFTVYLPRQI